MPKLSTTDLAAIARIQERLDVRVARRKVNEVSGRAGVQIERARKSPSLLDDLQTALKLLRKVQA